MVGTSPRQIALYCAKGADHDVARRSMRITRGVPHARNAGMRSPCPSLTNRVIPDPAGWPGLGWPRERRLLQRYGPQGGGQTGPRSGLRLGPHLLLDPGPRSGPTPRLDPGPALGLRHPRVHGHRRGLVYGHRHRLVYGHRRPLPQRHRPGCPGRRRCGLGHRPGRSRGDGCAETADPGPRCDPGRDPGRGRRRPRRLNDPRFGRSRAGCPCHSRDPPHPGRLVRPPRRRRVIEPPRRRRVIRPPRRRRVVRPP